MPASQKFLPDENAAKAINCDPTEGPESLPVIAATSESDRTDDWSEMAQKSSAGKETNQSSSANASGPDESSEDTQNSGKQSEHSRSLRSKLVLALAAMLSVVVGIDEIVRQRIIAPEFVSLERVGAMKDTKRVIAAINTDIDFLAKIAEVGASRLRQLDSKGPIATDWTTHWIEDRVDWRAISDAQGQWNWLGGSPSHREVRTQGNPFSQMTNVFTSDSALDLTSPEDRQRKGMVLSDDGELFLFASIAIDPERHFVVGRRLDEAMVDEICKRTSVQFEIDDQKVDPLTDPGSSITEVSDELLTVRVGLANPFGDPLASLVVSTPRDVTIRSQRTTAFARYLSLCGACVSVFVLLLLLQYMVIGRIESIRERTERIAQSGIIAEEADSRIQLTPGADEIGQLAFSFDRMKSRLGDAQRRLTDASHAAGMSFVADTVIHNVGNVLTNVNSLIETATERVQELRTEPLEKLADRLRAEEVNEALQKATPDYLQRLSETLEDDKDELALLLKTLNENVQHIHQVIRDQRRHAQQTIEWTEISLNEIIGEAVRCSQARLEQDNVRVEIASDTDIMIRSDRSLLLQILINIIGNARNAMRDIKGRQPKLRVDLIRTVSTVHLRFRDNGCGMDEETLSRIFDAHFTTRQSGSGLGLHFCAIAMKRVGGSIHAESDGPDRGATFFVDIPLHVPSEQPASRKTRQTQTKSRSDEDQELQVNR